MAHHRFHALFDRRPGEYRMRLIMLGVLVGCFCLDPIRSVNAASWTSAKFPGEQGRAVQGCGDNARNPGDWLCIVVRCDHPGSPLSLHLSVPEPGIEGDIELVTDENTFALSVARSVEALPLSTRAVSVPPGLINAMKSGHMIVIHGSRLQSPYNQISLENSRTAIERVEGACAFPFQGATRFWRRIARRMGVF
jgi:hypothetical protein